LGRRASGADHLADARRERVDREGFVTISMPGSRKPCAIAAFSA
jgi:hypothetical protein